MPPTPTDLTANLLNDGRIEFCCGAPAAGGAVFLVQRQIVPVGEAPGAFVDVGQAGDHPLRHRRRERLDGRGGVSAAPT